MSSKQDKKARKVLRKKISIEGKEIVLSLQGLILKFSFRKRVSIALKIMRGQSFLGGVGLDKDNG